VELLRGRYRGEIRYVDRILAGLLGALASPRLRGRTLVIITADRGEEFMEHGLLVHRQAFHPTIRIPLLLLVPGWRGPGLVEEAVELTDIAPTIRAWAGLGPDPRHQGRNLLEIARGARRRPAEEVYYESCNDVEQAIEARVGGVRYKAMVRDLSRGEGRCWVQRREEFDVRGPVVRFRMAAYREPRVIRAYLGERLLATWRVEPRWGEFMLRLPEETDGEDGWRTIRLVADDCISPRAIGVSNDPRCLSVQLKATDSVSLLRERLFDLDADPGERRNLARDRPELFRRLMQRLRERLAAQQPLARRESLLLDQELEERLQALGYLR
jgi:hypothetical protein